MTLQWHHTGRDGVSKHQPHECLLNRLFRHRSKKTSKRGVTGLCAGNSPVTGEFPAQMASNAENVSIWWRLHDNYAKQVYFRSKIMPFDNFDSLYQHYYSQGTAEGNISLISINVIIYIMTFTNHRSHASKWSGYGHIGYITFVHSYIEYSASQQLYLWFAQCCVLFWLLSNS